MPIDCKRIASRYRVRRGARVRLRDFDPADTGGPELDALGPATAKQRATAFLEENRAGLRRAQELLWATDTHSVLLVLQSMDAAGKDGTIKHVMSGLNPQGCDVHGFKRPSEAELDHNFLWRYWDKVPERGRIGIFNRSYYEEVLVVKVHPKLVVAERVTGGKPGKGFWDQRYEDINHFEQHLARNGTVIVKCFLNLSKGEQKRRLLARIEDDSKHWKFSPADLAERAYWDDYMMAYEAMLNATSTPWAPWYVIPADHKYSTRAIVAAILTGAITSLGLSWPKPTKEQMRGLAEAKKALGKADSR